jgi:hypothetical protein
MRSGINEQTGTVSKGVQRGQPVDSSGGEAQFTGQKNGFGLTVMGVERSVQIVFSPERFSMKNCDRLCKRIFWCFAAVLWTAAGALGQWQQDIAQLSQEPSAQSQPEQKKSEPAADAAKKTEKEKTKPKKVYTEEDLSGMRGNGVSVVGDEKPAGAGGAAAKKTDGTTKMRVAAMSGQDEDYWRGKARPLLDEILEVVSERRRVLDGVRLRQRGPPRLSDTRTRPTSQSAFPQSSEWAAGR